MQVAKHRMYWIAHNAVRQAVAPGPRPRQLVDDSPGFPNIDPVLMVWPSTVQKPRVGLVPDAHPLYPYWTKYRRFLDTNEIPYALYDVHASGWIDAVQEFDIVVWRPDSAPAGLEECRRKVFLLERHLGKLCLPTVDMVMLYEDKALEYYLLKLHGLPVVETFISNSYEEAMGALGNLTYPLVAKITTGAGSLGTELIRDERAARRLCQQTFSFAGRRTYWPNVRQKGYVYLQRLVSGAEYDLRVIIVEDAACGYFRDVPPGEFRASGMHTERHGDLPSDALSIARAVAKALELPSVAVDMLYDADSGKHLIIELSTFTEVQTTVETPAHVKGVPGVYRYSEAANEWRFEAAEFWLQEWALRGFLEKYWVSPRL